MANTYYKTAQKTAKANNWTLADPAYGCKVRRVFDFSLLDTVDGMDDGSKKVIRDAALQAVSAGNRESFYGHAYDSFTVMSGSALYAFHGVYDAHGRRLYDVFHLARVRHFVDTRKSVYDDFGDRQTFEAAGNVTHIDIELEEA